MPQLNPPSIIDSEFSLDLADQFDSNRVAAKEESKQGSKAERNWNQPKETKLV